MTKGGECCHSEERISPLSVILRSFAPKNLRDGAFEMGGKILRCAQNDNGGRRGMTRREAQNDIGGEARNEKAGGNHSSSSKNWAMFSMAWEAFLTGNIWNTCHMSSQTSSRQGTPASFMRAQRRSESEYRISWLPT